MMKMGKILHVVRVIISFSVLLCCIPVQAVENGDAAELISTTRHYLGSSVYAGN